MKPTAQRFFINPRLIRILSPFLTSMLYTNMFLTTFLTYGASLGLFPVYKKYVTSVYYNILNVVFLGCLLTSLFLLCTPIILYSERYTWSVANLLAASTTVPFGLSLQLNDLSWAFSILVTIIGFATNIYLLNYFKGEARENHFIFWLNSFIFSMLLLLLSNNLFTLFLGWEGIGLTSFFLINFWNTRRATVKSSFKAFAFNTFSDLCLLFALVLLFSITGTDQLDSITAFFSLCESAPTSSVMASWALALCAAAKSVQLGGHIWLPDSMEAPVPASALIHSATLVSAGIYLILKFNIIFFLTELRSFLILWGGATALIGGLAAAAQTDMKKLLAYSTMSHCGFLWGLAAAGNAKICVLYLFLHGLFKAGTFFAAGNIIQLAGTQDLRWMRNNHNVPGDLLLLLITSANLCGLPLSLGYFYKAQTFISLGSGSLSPLAVSSYLLAMLTSIVYFYRLNSFWFGGFNRAVKRDITENINFNLAKKPLGFTQINSFVAVSLIILASFLTIKLFFLIESPIFQVFGSTNMLNYKSTLIQQLFYWVFFIVLMLLVYFHDRRSSYHKTHMKFLVLFSSLLSAFFWNLIVYVSLHHDGSFFTNKL